MSQIADNASTPAVESPSRRINDIEWLRAIAVLGVVVHHSQDNLFSWQPMWLKRVLGHFDLWSGVDIFFAISGFVIARTLIPQLSSRHGEMRVAIRLVFAFWTARAFRLLPSAWLWLGLILLASATLNTSGAFGSVHANLMAGLAGVFQVANFRFADAFDRYNYGASFVYWSLSLEEQFYLMLPLLMIFARRRLVFFLIPVIVVQALMTRGLTMLSLRTDALAWGVLLAWLSQYPGFLRALPNYADWRRYLPRLVAYSIVAGIGMVSAAETVSMGNRVAIIAVLAAVLVWIAAYNRDYLSGGNSLLRRCMLWCGSRSYAIYLIHVPTFFLVREIWLRATGSAPTGGIVQTVVLTAAAAGLIALFAELNFRLVEKPLRDVGKRLSARISAPTTLVASRAVHAGDPASCQN